MAAAALSAEPLVHVCRMVGSDRAQQRVDVLGRIAGEAMVVGEGEGGQRWRPQAILLFDSMNPLRIAMQGDCLGMPAC